ncbi:MAG: SRPBCC domain-containing protein [Bacteroidota bacterium]
MKTGSIKQTVFFSAPPEQVFQLIMDAEKHADFTGSEVQMSTEIHGTFEVFDGYCHGYNIELIEGQKIVQAWHFEEDGWPADHFSICTFQFDKDDKNTKMTFIQTGIPEHKVEALKSGWNEFYWEPMESYLQDN